nr:hypothetical protein BaRGS_004163 [Batillaria attramentaria]
MDGELEEKFVFPAVLLCVLTELTVDEAVSTVESAVEAEELADVSVVSEVLKVVVSTEVVLSVDAVVAAVSDVTDAAEEDCDGDVVEPELDPAESGVPGDAFADVDDVVVDVPGVDAELP